jgi:hypothetical protein
VVLFCQRKEIMATKKAPPKPVKVLSVKKAEPQKLGELKVIAAGSNVGKTTIPGTRFPKKVIKLNTAGMPISRNEGLTPTKAIRLHCLECSGGSAVEVKNCRVVTCQLHHLRRKDT